MPHIVLASKSPRRHELLRRMGITDFSVVVPDVEETYPEGLAPQEIVAHIARLKSDAVAPLVGPEDILITADTMVFLDNDRLGKPRDEDDAFRMLRELAGRGHTVCTGVSVRRGAQEERFAQVAVLEVLRQVAAFTHVVFENERRTDGPVEGVPFDIERCRRLPDTEVDVVGRVYGPRNVALVGASQPGVVLVQTVHGQRRVAVREILHDLGAVAPDHFVGLHVVGFFVEILATREHCSSYKQIKYFFHRSSVLD